MGSYPSADLAYGIDLGLSEDVEYTWYTDELEKEYGSDTDALDHLLKDVSGVGYVSYGNAYYSNMGLLLCTRSVGIRSYEAREIQPEELTVTEADTEALRAAWAVLHPGQEMPEPKWIGVVSYG